MLKFMLLDLFTFRSVGSKPKFMQIITILNILNIALLFFLTFSIGAPYFLRLFIIFNRFLSFSFKKQ